MFIQLHLTVEELNVTSVTAFNRLQAFDTRLDSPTFFAHLHSRRLSVLRAIVERVDEQARREYHCVDFTGRSFLIVDENPPSMTSQELGEYIDKYADHFSLPSKPVPYAAILGPGRKIPVVGFPRTLPFNGDASKRTVRALDESEYYFHEYVKTLTSEYFIGA